MPRLQQKEHARAFLLLKRLPMSLLRSCRSDICPETADRSFWNVERNDSRESRSWTLVCGGAARETGNIYDQMPGALPELGRGALRTPWLDRELEERVNETA